MLVAGEYGIAEIIDLRTHKPCATLMKPDGDAKTKEIEGVWEGQLKNQHPISRCLCQSDGRPRINPSVAGRPAAWWRFFDSEGGSLVSQVSHGDGAARGSRLLRWRRVGCPRAGAGWLPLRASSPINGGDLPFSYTSRNGVAAVLLHRGAAGPRRRPRKDGTKEIGDVAAYVVDRARTRARRRGRPSLSTFIPAMRSPSATAVTSSKVVPVVARTRTRTASPAYGASAVAAAGREAARRPLGERASRRARELLAAPARLAPSSGTRPTTVGLRLRPSARAASISAHGAPALSPPR